MKTSYGSRVSDATGKEDKPEQEQNDGGLVALYDDEPLREQV